MGCTATAIGVGSRRGCSYFATAAVDLVRLSYLDLPSHSRKPICLAMLGPIEIHQISSGSKMRAATVADSYLRKWAAKSAGSHRHIRVWRFGSHQIADVNHQIAAVNHQIAAVTHQIEKIRHRRAAAIGHRRGCIGSIQITIAVIVANAIMAYHSLGQMVFIELPVWTPSKCYPKLNIYRWRCGGLLGTSGTGFEC